MQTAAPIAPATLDERDPIAACKTLAKKAGVVVRCAAVVVDRLRVRASDTPSEGLGIFGSMG